MLQGGEPSAYARSEHQSLKDQLALVKVQATKLWNKQVGLPPLDVLTDPPPPHSSLHHFSPLAPAPFLLTCHHLSDSMHDPPPS